MRFPFLPVTAFEDITRDLEALQGKAILDKTPTNFLQLLSTQKLQIQVGQTTVAAAIGVNNFPIGLPGAWPTAHIAFLAVAAAFSTSSASDFSMQSYTNGLGGGGMRISSSVAQNWQVNWISLGN